MNILLKTVKILDIFSFLVANIVLFLFFLKFLPNLSIYVLILSGLFSLILLKINYVIYIIDQIRSLSCYDSSNTKTRTNFTTTKTEFYNYLSLIRKIPILFKTISFEILFQLFPVFLIWLCIIGFIYIINGYLFTVSFIPHPFFFQMITSIGILLGVFQFYLQKETENVAGKISFYSRKMMDIISEETSFEVFKQSLHGENEEVKVWIDKRFSLKGHLIDLCDLLSDEEKRPIIKDLLTRIRIDTFIKVNAYEPASNTKYEILEQGIKNTKNESKLMSAYKSFFNSEELYKNIMSRIDNEINLNEFEYLCLSNLNIIQEVLPKLIDKALQESVEEIIGIESKTQKKDGFKTFKEYKQSLTHKVIKDIMKEILNN